MRNLDQARARDALKAVKDYPKLAGENGGEVVKKVAPMIRENGLLAAAAFALDKGKGHKDLFDAVRDHLAQSEIGLLKAVSLEDLIQKLAEGDTPILRAVTAETMAYLSYLGRFADAGNGGANRGAGQ